LGKRRSELAAEAEGEFWASLEQPVEVIQDHSVQQREAELRPKTTAFRQADFWAFSAGRSRPNLGQNTSASQAVHRPYQPAEVQAVLGRNCAGRTPAVLAGPYWACCSWAVQQICWANFS
jgi:hypothetical protein